MKDIEHAVKILKTAIEAEKESLLAYLEFARKVKDEAGKNMFIKLGIDEFEHINLFEKQLEDLCSKRACSDVEIKGSEIEKLVPRLDELEKENGLSGIDDVSALKTALELEKRGIEYYSEQAEKSQDKFISSMFKRLVEMEQSHYDLILAELDYIEKTGFWFNVLGFTGAY